MAPATHEPPGTPDKRQFAIKSCLGRGGFGEVYRAVMTNATGLETEVAVKVLHHDVDRDSQAVERLRDEGRMLGTLTHASILRVFDLVVLDGRVGLVLEYVEGQDLSKCIVEAVNMPPRAVVSVIGRVADALRAAWETPAPGGKGPLHLIHRDIKPQNIRIGTQGDVKLLDFGVARSSNVGRESETRTGNMVGSYLYMAPECLLENRFGPHSDIFGLGATMYESLAHRRLFQDVSLRELYVLVLKEEEYDDHIRRALEGIQTTPAVLDLLRSMVARKSEDRPTAAEVSALADDLAEGMEGPTLRRWCKARTWPEVNEVNGLLDGQTITEATIANMQMSDFTTHTPKSPWRMDWGVLMGTAGGLFMVIGILAGLIGAGVGALFFLAPRDGGARLVDPPQSSEILAFETGGDVEAERTEVGNTPIETLIRTILPQPTNRATARILVDSASPVKVQLVGKGGAYTRGRLVPPGTYSLQADWGEGFETKQTVTVSAAADVIAVKCNRYTRNCVMTN